MKKKKVNNADFSINNVCLFFVLIIYYIFSLFVVVFRKKLYFHVETLINHSNNYVINTDLLNMYNNL